MTSTLNRLVDLVEEHLVDELDVGLWASTAGTTEHHLRRMFSSLAGMPLSEYVRRRRMTVAATAVVAGRQDLLDVAVAHGYGSVEAFARAFRAVHGASPGEVRRDGGPLRAQTRLSFHLTLRGSTPMDVRVLDRPAVRLVGHAARVPLVHHGANPHIAAFVRGLPLGAAERLRDLSSTEPAGLLAVSDDLDPDRAEGSELTYLHGAAVDAGSPVPDDLDLVEMPSGTWAVVRSEGPHPQALQETWARTATEWFPSNRWRLRPGPEVLAVLEEDRQAGTATCELWLPVEAG